MFYGMVLRIQATSENQWQRWDSQFYVHPGNVDDGESLKQGQFLENIKGKLYTDKGYIGQALFGNLFLNGIHLVTKVKNNMKNSLNEYCRQDSAKQKSLDWNSKWRTEEHCTDRTLQTSFIQ